ncbi:MAG: 1,4-alpha-glucan branching protein GlgB [Clostridia bacterium]|nr:1,4-alpha-glucan branching protein GlgB [Clostridia bacterium]
MNKVKQPTQKQGDLPLYLFHQGTNFCAHKYLGAHFAEQNNSKGVVFRVWAPNADSVSVVGDFNGWNTSANVMKRISDAGVYELFIQGVKNLDRYKFAVTHKDKTVLKADPYAFFAEKPPKTASIVYFDDGYAWGDGEYIENRALPYKKPVNIYEVNLASWKRKENGEFYSYTEIAKDLTKYVLDMGYTHVEFMPLSEYPFDGSWGYQVTGYYAPTSRFGSPNEFKYLIDTLHQNGISIILDWVPAHFPKDEHGLFEFDGTPCYENQGWDRQENKTWGTRLFDLGRNEVQSFLISNALYLFENFHIDGLRVDAVASMLYLDYDKKDGEWIPNEYGGNHNLESIAFFKKLNTAVFEKNPYALMIAEESTAFSMITKPASEGGLGFNYKWNMGWMNDTLTYMDSDPYFRSGMHDKLTFSMCYAFSENYVLPISHDEVVHGKKSLLDKMPGSVDSKFANLRAYLVYMFAHPGKKLNFMGNEFGQFKEWNFSEGLEFFMLKFDLHKKLKDYNKEINFIYKNTPALYEIEDSWQGFQWIAVDERDNNVIAFKRIDENGNELIALMNFSGYTFEKYRLGVDKGDYKIILCSDDKKFGGQGRVTRKTIKSVKKPAHQKENSITIKLPAFTGMYLLKKFR